MRPKRSLGQNFLVDPNLQRKIVDALEAEPGDEVLEIGPGRGALTRHLVDEEPGRLILVELDDDLSAALDSEFGGSPDVQVIHGDILELELGQVVRDPAGLKVVGNIPYNITTPIVFQLLERPRPREIVLMVQKEVGERITAAPGTSAYGALAVGVQSVARAERLFDVGRGAFRPRPRVDSTVVRIRPRFPPPLTPREERLLRSLTRVAFQWRRKQFQTTLRKHPSYDLSPEEVAAVEERTGFDLTRRPERFSPEELLEIARILDEGGRPRGEAG
ncbi:MAG: ribosomal RNA small subunit methyltransferase A [Gemmatimonadetes bacterium]|nr:ribosomal RNA small subunit methyltransferase A [Gemmatimonadota bacterium]NIR77842.1 ribosomal RNA small subunit methyltransferase A [Gemmatimonadota bacterium]NIT86378.1 ribosomal RNA small subunit methyltransferase A [Gemmatimonadota bacterium]NIU30215.1 ribosomal RNA small subunit methyltransferase A [Gemmatimonadota bacterium]NIU35123.1 ribosomal RNA small subunit methyltransferase A [Gemmatimonadota bacterium]